MPRLMESFHSLTKELSTSYDINFVMVDDGSTDGTVENAKSLARNLNLHVISHGVNKGPGMAFASAFSYLANLLQDQDWVITMEGDNTSRHELIKQMLTRTKEGYEVVLASPYMYGGLITNTSFLRKLLSGGANLIVKDLLDIQGIMTVSSFFRLYSGATLKRLQIRYGPTIVERAGFESMIELLMKMIYQSTRISEVPMVLDTSLRKGRSKMKVLRTVFGYLTLWMDKPKWR